MYSNNIQNIVIGAERSGKTRFTRLLCESVLQKTGKAIIVYNIGDLNDYEGYEELKILSTEQTRRLLPESIADDYKDNKPILFFSFRGKVYKARDFAKIVAGKRVYIYKINSPTRQRMFYNFLFEYGAFIQVIFEDSRVLFQRGVPAEAQQVFGRKFHCGSKAKLSVKGLDCHFMFHGFNEINSELYNYTTNLTVFRFNVKPENGEIRSAELKRIACDLYEDLKRDNDEKGKYLHTHFEIFLKGYSEVKIIKFDKDYKQIAWKQ